MDTRKQHIIKNLKELVERLETTNTASEFFSMHFGSKKISPSPVDENGRRWQQFEGTGEYRVEFSWREIADEIEVCPRCRTPMLEVEKNHNGERTFQCVTAGCLCMMSLSKGDKK